MFQCLTVGIYIWHIGKFLHEHWSDLSVVTHLVWICKSEYKYNCQMQHVLFYYYQLDTQISCSFTQITLIKLLYMFRAHSAHHQEVHGANCTYAAPGIVNLCKWQSLAESDDTRGCICTICVVDLLMMGGMRSKHVEELN
jgi:hypothetical protein